MNLSFLLFLRTAGPCHNFESLYTFVQAQGLGDGFTKATTEGDIASTWKEIKAVVGHWDELMAACKTASGELNKVIGGKSKKPAQAKGKAKAKAKGGKSSSMYKLFDSNKGVVIPTLGLGQGHALAGMSMEHPFIVAKEAAPALLASLISQEKSEDNERLLIEMKDFKEAFAKSDMRFTAGKAQSQLSDGSHHRLKGCCGAVMSMANAVFPEPHQKASCFGVIGKHRAVQYEVGAVGGFRFSLAGKSILAVCRNKFLTLLSLSWNVCFLE